MRSGRGGQVNETKPRGLAADRVLSACPVSGSDSPALFDHRFGHLRFLETAQHRRIVPFTRPFRHPAAARRIVWRRVGSSAAPKRGCSREALLDSLPYITASSWGIKLFNVLIPWSVDAEADEALPCLIEFRLSIRKLGVSDGWIINCRRFKRTHIDAGC